MEGKRWRHKLCIQENEKDQKPWLYCETISKMNPWGWRDGSAVKRLAKLLFQGTQIPSTYMVAHRGLSFQFSGI